MLFYFKVKNIRKVCFKFIYFFIVITLFLCKQALVKQNYKSKNVIIFFRFV